KTTWHGPALLPLLRPGFLPARAFPNPARAATSIQFTTSRAGSVAIEILDLSGHSIRTIPSAHYDIGVHAWLWNGRNQTGVRVSPGVYVFVVRSDGHSSTGKITMLR